MHFQHGVFVQYGQEFFFAVFEGVGELSTEGHVTVGETVPLAGPEATPGDTFRIAYLSPYFSLYRSL